MEQKLNICWKTFKELTLSELYHILALREEVFILEQQCIYKDIDGIDQFCLHGLAYVSSQKIVSYLRIVPPGTLYPETSIGRVVTDLSFRKKGFTRYLFSQAIEKCFNSFPSHNILLTAQTYLIPFYSDFGFKVISAPYDDAGIMHVKMLLEYKAIF